MKQIMALLMAAVMTLTIAACGGDQTVNTTQTLATETVTEATTLPAETQPETTEAPTEPPTEPAGYSNPINGSKSDEPWQGRVFAVSLHNGQYGQPLWGIGQADVLMELLTDGGETRFLALFADIQNVAQLGPVASARPDIVNLARAYDAVYVHASGSRQAYDLLDELDLDHLDGITGDSDVFYRDQDRLDAGYSREYTLFTNGSDLVRQAEGYEMALTREQAVDFGYDFTVYPPIREGTSAREITLWFRGDGKRTSFSYDDQFGGYRASQFSQEMIDGSTEQPVVFQNVLVLEVEASGADPLLQMQLTGHGHGWFASFGLMIPINWVRDSEEGPFVFTTWNNEPLTFAVGSTYMALVPSGSPVKFE